MARGKSQIGHCLGGQLRRVLLVSWQLLLLEGLVLVPIMGCFACWVFCLSEEISWTERLNLLESTDRGQSGGSEGNGWVLVQELMDVCYTHSPVLLQ